MKIEWEKIEPMSFCIFNGKEVPDCSLKTKYEKNILCRLGYGIKERRYLCPFSEEFKNISQEEYSKRVMSEREESIGIITLEFSDLTNNENKGSE